MPNDGGPDQETLDTLGLRIYEDPADGKIVKGSSIYAIQDLLDRWREDGNRRNALMVLSLSPTGNVVVSRADRLVFPDLDSLSPEKIIDFKNGMTGTVSSQERNVLLFKTAGPNSIKVVETDNVFRIPASDIWVTVVTRTEMAEAKDLEGY